MDVHRGALNDGLVSFLRVLLRSMSEKTGGYSSSHAIVVFTGGENVMLISASTMSGH